jgi:glycosyltransferase involved in cell wall biosynthesis
MVDEVGRWILKARTKIEAIPNGVGESFGAASRSIAPGFTVGVIGNLVQSKQVDRVIRSFAGLDKGPPMARLLVVGDGPERAVLEALARRLGLGSRALFTGALPPEEIPGVLARCHTMVLASRSEGRPNVVLEAMAAGVPVVAGDIDGVRELIVHGERGLLFPVGDERRLAAHLRSLMDDPALGRRLAANARQWLDDQGLTWENTARRYADIYRQVIGQRQRRDRN